jgi:hypothetical protein
MMYEEYESEACVFQDGQLPCLVYGAPRLGENKQTNK